MASNDLKKVGLIFNADGSTDFIKSLKNVNATLKENYANFKLVQTQYDEETKASQKLRDKLEYLNSAYDAQKNKILILKEELNELTSAENRDEIAISKKKTALANAETQLERYNKQIQKTNKELELGTADIKEFAQKLDDSGKKIIDVGKKVSVASATSSAALAGISKAAVDFETAWAGVTKTVDGTDDQLAEIKQGLLDLSEATASSSIEIAAVAEAAGQLGVSSENILSFTETMVRLGDSTNLSADEAATAIAQLYNIMGSDINTVDRFGATLVALGNNAATTESDILNMATRIAAAGAQVGLTNQEVLALSTSLTSVGLEAEGGGSAISTVITSVDKAVALNSDTLKTWASTAGLSVSEFKKLWENDAMSAIQKIVVGMGDAKAGGENLNILLEELGVTSIRQTDTMKRLSGAGDLLNDMVKLSNEAWDENNALTNESDKRYATTAAKLTQLQNRISELCVKLGDILLPIIQKVVDKISVFVDWLTDADPAVQKVTLAVLGIVAALGPLIIMFGSVARGVSSIITLSTTLAPILTKLPSILGLLKGAIGGVSAAMSFLAANPIVLIIAAIAAVVAGIVYLWNNCEWFREGIIDIWNNITQVFTQFDEFLTNVFNTDWTEHFGAFGEVLNAFFANVSNYWNAIKQVFQGVTDFIKGVFTGDWSLAWEGIKNIFQGVFNGLLAIAKVPLNGIIGFLNMLISGINKLIKGFNKIKVNVPDWVPGIGGKTLGFNIGSIGKIPYLADGGTLLNGAAVVAEAGPELLLQEGNKTKVVPLNKNSKNTNIDDDNRNKDKPQVVNFNTTINNNSRYVGPAETARQSRNANKQMLLEWSR